MYEHGKNVRAAKWEGIGASTIGLHLIYILPRVYLPPGMWTLLIAHVPMAFCAGLALSAIRGGRGIVRGVGICVFMFNLCLIWQHIQDPMGTLGH